MAQRAMDAVEWDHGDGGDVLEVVVTIYLKGIENMAGWNIQDELFFSSSTAQLYISIVSGIYHIYIYVYIHLWYICITHTYPYHLRCILLQIFEKPEVRAVSVRFSGTTPFPCYSHTTPIGIPKDMMGIV